MFGQTLVWYLARDEGGVFEFAQQQAGGGITAVGNDTPNFVLRVPLVDGTTWPSTWQSTRDGRQVSFPTVKAIAATDETVMVPAGFLPLHPPVDHRQGAGQSGERTRDDRGARRRVVRADPASSRAYSARR